MPDEQLFSSEHLRTMEFEYYTPMGKHRYGYGVGITEAACLGDFLMKHPGITSSDICRACDVDEEPADEKETENKENKEDNNNDKKTTNA